MSGSKDTRNVSLGVKGMKRQGFRHLLDDRTFTFQRNGNLETDEEGVALTNEHSNFLCTRFKEGYVVLGKKFDPKTRKTLFFLVQAEPDKDAEGNDLPLKSSIGFVTTSELQDISDEIYSCNECDSYSDTDDLNIDITLNSANCTYEELIHDECNGCLNFSIDHPITDIVFKTETCGQTVTFTDGLNPPRYIILDSLERYKYTGNISCEEDYREPVCLDCDKLRVFPKHSIPCITGRSLSSGGNLRRGVYQFAICYADEQGNKITNTFSMTNPIHVFDKEDNIIPPAGWDLKTNKGVRITVENLDRRFKYYKIYVLSSADTNNSSTSKGIYDLGRFPITQDTILYTTNIEDTPGVKTVPPTDFTTDRPIYKKWGGVVTSNNYLIGYNYEVEPLWNLQPIANVLGSLVTWQSYMASEDVYSDGVNVSLYSGYMRDEVYPFGIRFITDEGYKTPLNLLISRPPTEEELQVVSSSFNNDIASITSLDKYCHQGGRDRFWQFYNTAKVEERCSSGISGGTILTQEFEESCRLSINLEQGGVFEFPVKGKEYLNMFVWIEDHYDEILDSGNILYSPTYYSFTNMTYEGNCPTDWEENNIFPLPICPTCEEGCDSPVKVRERILLQNLSVTNEEVILFSLDSYQHEPTSTLENYFFPGNISPSLKTVLLTSYQNSDLDEPTPANAKIEKVYQRNINYYENSYLNPIRLNHTGIVLNTEIIVKGQEINLDGPYISGASGGIGSVTTLYLTSDIESEAYPNEGFPETKLHVKGVWSSLGELSDYQGRGKYFEITKGEKFVLNDSIEDNTRLRYSVFSKTNNMALISSGIFDIRDGLFLLFERPVINQHGEILIYIDAPISRKEFKVINIDYTYTTDVEDKNFKSNFDYINAPNYHFDIFFGELKIEKVKVNYDQVELAKEQFYRSTCRYRYIEPTDCLTLPFEKGSFSYWESSIKYPDNPQLYDSSKLVFKKDTLQSLGSRSLNKLKNYYLTDSGGAYYGFKKDLRGKPLLDFTCKPIRHFKFPDNTVSPFMDTTYHGHFDKNLVYPLGISIKESDINTMLDVAVDSGLITKEQRDSVVGYEIFRGDRMTYKSVLAKGIANDMYEDPTNPSTGLDNLFRNFPYNSLGSNRYLSKNKPNARYGYHSVKITNAVPHPYDSRQNNRFSVIAPEVYFNHPEPPTEFKFEGYMYGSCLAGHSSVKKHPAWVVLGNKATKKARNLARWEYIFETIIQVGTLTMQGIEATRVGVGLSNSFNVPGSVAFFATLSAAALSIAVEGQSKIDKYTAQWLQIYEDRGTPQNFASMYISPKGWYNNFEVNKEKGNMLRPVSKYAKIGSGVPLLSEDGGQGTVRRLRINNRHRESSFYLSTQKNYPIKYSNKYINYDNADTNPNKCSRFLGSEAGCEDGINKVRNIASPYFSLKRYIPNQYGRVESIKWLYINHCSDLTGQGDCGGIFGGDTRISRFDFKNKVSLFTETAMKLANRIPFNYARYNNIAYPMFYMNHKTAEVTEGGLFDDYLGTGMVVDCSSGDNVFYHKPPTKFYLYLYGIPHFLVESDINAHFRYAGIEPWENFASNNIDTEDWVQEDTVSITHDNIFRYNPVYLRPTVDTAVEVLPMDYDKEVYDCLATNSNGVVWSQQDVSVDSLEDPWLFFRAFDSYRFPMDYGKLITMKPLEGARVLALFENNVRVFTTVDKGKELENEENRNLGTGGLFVTQPTELSFTDRGESGTQHKEVVSTEFGHFWCDAKRGKVFLLPIGDGGPKIISDYSSQGESGMRKWFKKHLPFKILLGGVEGLTNLDVDNAYKGLGLNMWWDSKFKRFFITKLDYIVNGNYKNKLTYSEGNFYYQGEKISLLNKEYFTPVHWTVAFSPIYNAWVSYYDFFPQYSVECLDYFQTGINFSLKDYHKGLWSHLVSNKSFQIYYGDFYPWEIEVPIKNNYVNNMFKSISIWTNSIRYHNDFDYAFWKEKSFNKAIIYNDTNNSGLLELNYEKTLNQGGYPKTGSSDISQGIPVVHFDNKVNINYVFNRVKNIDNHLPVWRWDKNMINKSLDSKAISFFSKRVLERLRGDWFLVRMIQDKNSAFKHYYKWQVSTTQPFN